MNAVKLQLFLLFNIFYVSDCGRRIHRGEQVYSKKSYMVYLVKAPMSRKPYKDWLCGGALVTPWFIITAQHCVVNIEHTYAIAGYNTYVPDTEIEKNQCTKEKKKKVVYVCVPEEHEEDINKWSVIDMALVKVESPYDFEDQSYKTLCSYIPSTIPINYEPRFQESGTDGFVLGWGHTDLWQQEDDKVHYNQKLLRYASIKIMDKEACIKYYKQYISNMEINIIRKYMICSFEKGELDENGKTVLIDKPQPKLNGCGGGLRLLSNGNVPCDEDLTSKEVLGSNSTNDSSININGSNIETKNQTLLFNQTNESRKFGICQNDQGGPLVTWAGGHEVLIGVASQFDETYDSKCTGPYLYTSTLCNGVFLYCMLNDSYLPNQTRSRSICDGPPAQRGYDTIETHISWKDHPAGAAENEVLVSKEKFVVNRHGTKAGLSKVLEGVIQLENETIAVRPQRPLKQ